MTTPVSPDGLRSPPEGSRLRFPILKTHQETGDTIIAYMASCPLLPDPCIRISLPAINPWETVLS